MNTNHLNAYVNLIDEKVKMQAHVPGKPGIIMDYTPPLGRGEGYTSLEVLLISLASCYGTAVKSLVTAQLKREIRGMSLNITGDRQSEHPSKFQTIRLFMEIDSPDLQMEELKRAAELAEKNYCPVWAMIQGNVMVVTDLKINEHLKR